MRRVAIKRLAVVRAAIVRVAIVRAAVVRVAVVRVYIEPFSNLGPTQKYPNWDFWFENIPSGKLGKFWKALQWKMLLYFMAIRYILWPFGIFFGNLVYVTPFWYIVPRKI
jgi:hypothetical protein